MKHLLTGALTGLALLGLVLSPVIRPAMAMETGAAMHGDVAADAAMDMADMPCCPDSAPKPDCVKACMLLASCMGKTLQAAAHATAPLVAYSLAIVVPGNDARPDGFAQPPPPRPPDV